MGLYERWCESTKEEHKRKRYWTYVEKDGGRDEISGDLAQTIRSHYNPSSSSPRTWRASDTRLRPKF